MNLLSAGRLGRLDIASDVVRLFHGTTRTAAQSILAEGVNRTFFMTSDAQLALEYACLRAVREEAEPAIIEVAVRKDLLSEMSSEPTLHVRPLVTGCHSLSQVVFRLGSWEWLNRCGFRGWRLDVSGLKEMGCAEYLEQAG